MVHKRSPYARKLRNKTSRERGKRKRQSMFDQKTGEVINIQPRYVQFEVVPKNLGFLSASVRDDDRGMMFLHQGEVLIDWRGEGTIQACPEVFDLSRGR